MPYGRETTRHRLARYAATTLILGVIAALFVRQQLGSAAVGEADLGPVDQAQAVLGQPAPDFALRTLDGGVVRLSDFRGKTVVLNFWASWCPPCREEMPEFQALVRARGDSVVVLAVDYRPLDSEAEARRFIAQLEQRTGAPMGFPLAFDTLDGAVAVRYGVAQPGAKQAALPVNLFIDRNGVLRDRLIGPVTGILDARLEAVERSAN